jgi:GTP-binding protein
MIAVLLETMRREGYEFAVQKPHVLLREEHGQTLEPIEYLTVDVPQASAGRVIEILGGRRAELLKMDKKGSFTRLEFTVPARGLIGVRSRLLNATAGEATMHHVFSVYEGMVVGEHCKDNDLCVNLSREKKATNVRSSTKEAFVKLPPPRVFGIEDALEYVGEDELVEITPKAVRLRKTLLKENERKRSERQRQGA